MTRLPREFDLSAERVDVQRRVLVGRLQSDNGRALPDQRRRAVIAGVALVLASGLIGTAALVRATSSDAGPSFDATSPFSVFSKGAQAEVPADLTNSPALSGKFPAGFDPPSWMLGPEATADFSRARELGRQLGDLNLRLLAFPREDSASVCYALFGEKDTDPGMLYCYRPGNPDGSVEHFNVSAPYAFIDGQSRIDIFGVAYDDVERLRVQVDGVWRSVPFVSTNGFYLGLPGVIRDQLGYFEATLADGTVQLHSMQTDSPVDAGRKE